MKSNITRLTADHIAAIAAALPQSPVWNGQQAAIARKAGQQAALETLNWAQVDAVRRLLPSALCPGFAWCPEWAAARLTTLAGPVFAASAAASVTRFDEFAAWVQGVDDIALAVEAAALAAA